MRKLLALSLSVTVAARMAAPQDACVDHYMKFLDKSAAEFDGIYSSPLYRRCRYATQNIFDAMSHEATGHFVFSNDLLSAAASGETIEHLNEIREYSRYCLPHPSETSNEAFRIFLDEVVNSLVIITAKGDPWTLPRCNGVVWRGSVLSARHCFLYKLDDVVDVSVEGFNCKADVLDLHQFAFWLRKEGKFVEVEVDDTNIQHPSLYAEFGLVTCRRPEFNEGARKLIAESDWIRISLPGSTEMSGIDWSLIDDLQTETAGELDFASVASSKFKIVSELSVPEPRFGADLFESTLTTDFGLLCRPIHSTGSVFVHGCHTQDISSGSPIVAYRIEWIDGETSRFVWAPVGINTGPGAFEGVCGTLEPIGGGTDGAVGNGGVFVR